MTMKQLARLAGVSVSTVSKAFSGSKEISAAQRERIFALAKENECYHKYNKQTHENDVIAVVSREFQSDYYARQLALLEQEIQKRGGIMVTGCSNFDLKAGKRLVDYFVRQAKVRGVIMYDRVLSDDYEVPIVVIGESAVYDSIKLSWEKANREAISLLLENGHRDIAFIGETYTDAKRKAFLDAVREYGISLPKEYIVKSEERFEQAGYNEMQKLLALENVPTAVLVAYDSIAIGAMKCIREHGLKIPEDISIIGMDDIKINPYFDVPLASVTSYDEDLCEIAVDMLFERINNTSDEAKKTVSVSAELVKRSSVGKAKR